MGAMNREMLYVIIFLISMVGLSESSVGVGVGAAVTLLTVLASLAYLSWESYQDRDTTS